MAIEDYDELLGAMEHTLNDLNVALASLNEEELRLAGEIGVQETNLEQATAELNAATNELHAKEAQCEEWEAAYKSTTEKRREEIDIVAQCLDIFVNENDKMSDYLSDRVEN
jgi:septal ring factor EnvC (AmiA/AmiB activator)